MWVLIVFALTSTALAGSLATHEFSSKERCEAAGVASNALGAVRYVCVEK